MHKFVLFLLSTVLIFTGCKGIKSIAVFRETSPYEKYVQSIEKAGLHTTPMAQEWLTAGEKALTDSVIVALPFSEAGFFQAGEPRALSWQFTVRAGQMLTVEGAVKSVENAKMFLDLFIWEDSTWQATTYADSTLSIRQEFDETRQCLLRLQPELLVNAYYSISIAHTPVLINPVTGASNKSIQSFYGDPRDGGKRKHEGVDIFAPKGTPVVAPADGYVTRTGNTNLGGKVVWMADRKRGHNYYFAHLDTQLVKAGMTVRQGDTLGLVGNTGNARYTPPHLHFGIYQRGSRDPIDYIRTMERLVNRLPLDTTFQSLAYRVESKKLNVRIGPGEKHKSVPQLSKHDYIRIIGKSGDWYRVWIPGDRQGFVHHKYIVPASKGRHIELSAPATLLSKAHEDAIPVLFFTNNTTIELLARHGKFGYIRTAEGQLGWVVI